MAAGRLVLATQRTAIVDALESIDPGWREQQVRRVLGMPPQHPESLTTCLDDDEELEWGALVDELRKEPR